MLRAGIEIHTALGCDGRPVRPGRGPICGNGFRLGPLVHLAGRCLPSWPTGRASGIPRTSNSWSIPVLPGAAQRPGAPPAPDEQARDLALDAPPQRRGHCLGHRRRRHRRRVQELHIPGLLSNPRRFCRGLLVLLAQSRLDDGGRRRLRRRVPERRLRSRPGRRQREGAAGQAGDDVYHRAGHRFHRPVRTHQVAQFGGKGAGAAAGTHRALPDDSRHHRPDPPT